jgi:pyroglutamyl-peptidase
MLAYQIVAVQDVPVVIAEDHPRFLCGYIYYSSLARCCNKGEKRRLVFLHVPIEYGSRDIQTGVRVASSIISAMVDDLASQID